MIGRHRSAIALEVETLTMTDTEYTSKLDELDRLLNDPDVAMEPEKVWSLLAEITSRATLLPTHQTVVGRSS
jgi:hypothetical protein